MNWTILLVFLFVYLGMILGRLPGFALDRTGIALLGALLLLVTDQLTLTEAWLAVDVPTIALLFGLMIVSAQFRLGGFYSRLTLGLAAADRSPERLLALMIAASGLLSALLANDIVCLAMAPMLVEGCLRRQLNPRPFLLALACAANVGSAATLIGNPQNMLIGQSLELSFAGYLLDGGLPALLGLGLTWWIIARVYRGRWHCELPPLKVEAPVYDPWQTRKGFLVLILLVAAFLVAPWPRELLALAAAGFLLSSRHLASRRILALVDWQLLVLFIGLFIVNQALADAGLLAQGMQALAATGVDLHQPGWLFTVTVLLANLVSNVPATLLLLPAATHPLAGPVLALASTLAGNLLIVGSIANIIVVDQAARLGITIDWREHARIGIPVTLTTLTVTALWLWWRAGMIAGG
ncbi:MAG: SLC13 family permease [Desulfuromonadales bacterium]